VFVTKNTEVIGLDIGAHSVKLARLNKTRKGFQLVSFGIMPVPPDAIVDGVIEKPEDITEAIRKLVSCEKLKTKHVVTAISGESVIIKKINVPVMTDEELAESISLEAEQYIPFDIDDVNIDFQIIQKTRVEDPKEGGLEEEEPEDQMDVILVAVKKDVIAERISLINGAGLHSVVIDLDVFAIENEYEFNYGFQEGEVVALVDIGASLTNINILEGRLTSFTRDLSIGGNVCTHAIQNELTVGPEVAENLKMGIETEGVSHKEVIPIITSATESLSQEIAKSFEFYSTAANREIDKVVLSGGWAAMEGIDRFLANSLGLPVEIVDPFKHIKVNYNIFDPGYIKDMAPIAATSIGLAMRRFDDR